MSVEARAPFYDVIRSISYQSESNDSPVQQFSGDASHFSSGVVEPISEATEAGAFVHSFGCLRKDVTSELLETRNGTLVPALKVAEQRTQQLGFFDSTNTNLDC
jgi:hypothetical protein